MVSITPEREKMQMSEFTNVAISKNRFGTIFYAIIDDARNVVAMFKAKDGFAYQINFIETTPMSVKKVADYISDLERKKAL